MTHTDDLMANLPGMAEMTGGLLEADGGLDVTPHADGVDLSQAVATELAAEGRDTTATPHADPITVPAGLAALEAETEE